MSFDLLQHLLKALCE